MSSTCIEDLSQTCHRTPSELEPECVGEAIGYNVDEFGFASCTEGLGFESSNMITTSCHCDCCSFSDRISEVRREIKRLSPEKKDFPPPLSSLSVNGRRNFTLEPVRSNGRLEILRVSINRPEILWASRINGRLRLHLVSSDDDDDEEEEETEEEEIELIGEEERQNDVGETTADEAEAAELEEEREWNIPAIRRCYQREVLYAWSQQRTRCVTTM